MSPLVYIVILTWNSATDTLECLDSLQHLDYPNPRVVVVDNGSLDNTVATVRERFPDVHVIENGQNLGYAEGNNVGIRYALENRADYIFVLNDDTTVRPDTLALLVDRGEQDPAIGMLGSSVVSYFDHSKEFLGARVDWRHGLTFQIPYSPDGVGDADHVAGCALLVKAKVAREIGLFDADYFCYFEDTDWGVRCLQAGYRVVTVFSSKVYHKGTPDFRAHESPALLFYYRRNQYRFMRKYTKGRQWRAFLSRYVRQCLMQFHHYEKISEKDKANAVISGLWAGITGHCGAQQIEAPGWLKQLSRSALKMREQGLIVKDGLRGRVS